VKGVLDGVSVGGGCSAYPDDSWGPSADVVPVLPSATPVAHSELVPVLTPLSSSLGVGLGCPLSASLGVGLDLGCVKFMDGR
jgi:hypothetical protein